MEMKRGLIEIEEDESELFEINVNVVGGGGEGKLSTIKEEVDDRSLFSFDFRGGRGQNDVVYVAISGDGESIGNSNSSNSNYSMDALIWTLNNICGHSSSSSSYNNKTLVHLVHIYPPLRFIPTLLGNFPIKRANPEQKRLHLELEKIRRQEYLQTFQDLCFSSAVKVEILSIESDSEEKALVDLIPILNMQKLIIGIPSTKNMKKSTSTTKKKINGFTDYVVRNAPEFCEVKVICGGEEVILMSNSTKVELIITPFTSSSSSSNSSSSSSSSSTLSSSLNNTLIPRSNDHHDHTLLFHSFQFCKCLRGDS